MADEKITDLAVATTPNGIDNLFEIAQDDGGGGFSSKSLSLQQLITALGANNSGTFTPTLTIVTNLDTLIAHVCYFTRIGDVVTVNGQVQINATAAGDIVFRMSLPIASVFGNVRQLSGVSANDDTTLVDVNVLAIRSDTVNNEAEFRNPVVSLTTQTYHFNFAYLILS